MQIQLNFYRKFQVQVSQLLKFTRYLIIYLFSTGLTMSWGMVAAPRRVGQKIWIHSKERPTSTMPKEARCQACTELKHLVLASSFLPTDILEVLRNPRFFEVDYSSSLAHDELLIRTRRISGFL